MINVTIVHPLLFEYLTNANTFKSVSLGCKHFCTAIDLFLGIIKLFLSKLQTVTLTTSWVQRTVNTSCGLSNEDSVANNQHYNVSYQLKANLGVRSLFSEIPHRLDPEIRKILSKGMHLNRAAASGVLGGGAPPYDHPLEILFSCRNLWDLNVHVWTILRRKDAQKHARISDKK